MAIPNDIDRTLIKYFKVTWAGLVSILDGPDPDDLPDLDTLSGSVTFTPNLAVGDSLKFKSTTHQGIITKPFSVIPMRRKVNIDASQFNDQSRSYVMLESPNTPYAEPSGWTWRVDFDLYYDGFPVPLQGFNFTGDPDGEVDLTNLAPGLDASTGTWTATGPRGISISDVKMNSAETGFEFYGDDPQKSLIATVIIPSLLLVPQAEEARDQARIARDQAEAAENTAKIHRDNAAGSASAAGIARDQAQLAKGGADTALAQADTARDEARLAETGAKAAETTARQYRNEAGAHASDADTARAGAVTAREGSELARDESRSARDDSESAADLSGDFTAIATAAAYLAVQTLEGGGNGGGGGGGGGAGLDDDSVSPDTTWSSQKLYQMSRFAITIDEGETWFDAGTGEPLPEPEWGSIQETLYGLYMMTFQALPRTLERRTLHPGPLSAGMSPRQHGFMRDTGGNVFSALNYLHLAAVALEEPSTAGPVEFRLRADHMYGQSMSVLISIPEGETVVILDGREIGMSFGPWEGPADVIYVEIINPGTGASGLSVQAVRSE